MQYSQVHFPCTDQHPQKSCMQKPKKKSCGAQERESIWGLVSVNKHHHTASHLSWDSTAPHQTKPLATDLSFSVIDTTELPFPFILLSSLVAIFHLLCYLFFSLSGYINPLKQVLSKAQQADEMHLTHHQQSNAHSGGLLQSLFYN